MRMKFWITAMGCALISFIVLWEATEKISYSRFLEDGKWPDHPLGYQAAAILAFPGIAGIVTGIILLKKRRLLAAGLIGFFLVPFLFGILTFIFGPL